MTTEAELSAAIADNVYIVLEGDITLYAGGEGASAFTISGLTGLTIDGAGHTLGFATSAQENGRIFYISSASEVVMLDLTLAYGYAYSVGANIYGCLLYTSPSPRD